MAATVVEVLLGGGRRYENGRLVETRLGTDVQRFTLPDGESVTTAGLPSGELHAAWIASGAPSVISTSDFAPSGRVTGAILPAASALMKMSPVRRFATRRLAGTKTKARPRPREHSWGHAVIRWPDGTSREGWLRAPDGMAYTAAAAAEVAIRLARGDASPGAYTPAGAFGPDIATDIGADFILGLPIGADRVATVSGPAQVPARKLTPAQGPSQQRSTA